MGGLYCVMCETNDKNEALVVSVEMLFLVILKAARGFVFFRVCMFSCGLRIVKQGL